MGNKLPLMDRSPRWFSRSGPEEETVISSRIRISRNIRGYLFPPAMNKGEREALALNMSALFMKSPLYSRHEALLSLGDLTPTQRQLLWERKILSHRLNKEGEGFLLLSSDESVNIALCLDDHLQFIGLDSGLSLDSLHRRITPIIEAAGEDVVFCRNDRGDFLTSRVDDRGTGLRASVIIQLPGLSLLENMEPLFLALMDRGLSIRGFLDDEDFSTGGLFQIYNTGGAGFSRDEEILNSLTEAVKILIVREESSRNVIRAGSFPRVEDRVYRSLGALRYCRMLSAGEALKHLALIRQGVCLGWISEISLEVLSALILYSGDAHMRQLLIEEGREPSEEACLIRRARFVRDVLSKGLTFLGV